MSTAAQSADISDDLAEVFASINEPVCTAVEVAEELGLTQQAAHHRLQQAHERGAVERKTVGARAVVWWVPDLVVDERLD
jgi:predicted ArsR family transcriptional regulator